MAVKLKPIIFYTVLFLFILVHNTTLVGYDYDLWARLIAGMGFVQTGHVLKQDFLSYTPTHTWFDHEWGSGVIFYLTQHFFGATGLLILQSILIFLIFFIITKIVELRGVKTTSAYNFLFYFFALGTINYIFENPIRCQLFTFLFFTIFIYILERARKGIGKDIHLIISLPILMLIWNNLHGGCVSGIGLIVIYIVGEFLNKKPLKTLYPYIFALTLSLLVLPINPWGIEYLTFLFKANTMPRPNVTEWWGLFCRFNTHNFIELKITLAVLLLIESGFALKGIIAKKFDFDKTKYLLLTITLFLAILHVKLIPLFVITATCFLYDDFYTAFNFITKNFFVKKWVALIKDIIVYVVILSVLLINIKVRKLDPVIDFESYPISSIEFVKINNIKGNLLINFPFGSYASYKLYPNNKIFIDGRYEEVYYDFMLPLLKKFYLVNKNWDEILKRFPPDIMILEKYYPIYQTLQKSKEWSLVFDKDKSFGVFVKTKNLKPHYKNPSTNLDYYKKTLFDTNINFMLQSKHEQQ